MEYVETFKVEKVTDTVVDKAEEEDLQHVRIVALNTEDATMTLKGDPEDLHGFRTGISVRVLISDLQTTLPVADEE